MLNDVKVIAFDIDGTLYPAFRFNVRIVWHVLRHLKFFINYGKVRESLRRVAPLPDLYHYQAILLSERMHCTTPEAEKLINELVYKVYPEVFKKIKPYKNIVQTFAKIKEAGYEIAILSDFPPEQKGDIWGVLPYCNGVFSAEKIGALKPSKYPFGIMCQKMKIPAKNFLYVGNSKRCDIFGAKNAGMKTCYILPWWRQLLHLPLKQADICIKNYRQFLKIVLE